MQLNVDTLGQVFTPNAIVQRMFGLVFNKGIALEPSSGDGAFFNHLEEYFDDYLGLEIDPKVCPKQCDCRDFFDYSTDAKFNTIIGNPPYVGYKNIAETTKSKLKGFDCRTNLYIFFIDKCLDHLCDHGEIVFITPRDFIKATHAKALNDKMYSLGTLTHFYELGDASVFKGYSPNCVIWRFEKDNFSRETDTNLGKRQFNCHNGQISFQSKQGGTLFSDLFNVKVGGVSGCDEIYANQSHGNKDFVYSKTCVTGGTRKMVHVDQPIPYLESFKDTLINRQIRQFNECNWWQWGREWHKSDLPRLYVNCKTRNKKPFFTHECKNYDGSVLAIFPKREMNLADTCDQLNLIDWEDLGFVCDGRYQFNQRSLSGVTINL